MKNFYYDVWRADSFVMLRTILWVVLFAYSIQNYPQPYLLLALGLWAGSGIRTHTLEALDF